jgi:hypothetical protein
MRSVTKKMAPWLGWIALGVLVATGAIVALPRNAQAASPISYLQPGLLDKNACYPWGEYPYPDNACWHSANSGHNTAIDYNYYGGSCPPYGNNCTGGHSVYLYFTGDGVQTQPFTISVIYYCQGVEARLYQGGYYKGEARYLHMAPRAGVDGLQPTSNFTWLGTVIGSPDSCPWGGPNLHQDADVSSYTPFYTNWTGNHPYDYSHRIQW